MTSVTVTHKSGAIPGPAAPLGVKLGAWLDALQAGFRRTPVSALAVVPSAVAVQVGERLGEAVHTWTAHLQTAQSQMTEATESLLVGFTQILEELNHITGADGQRAAAVHNTVDLDERARMLSNCEAKLHGLLTNFQEFIQSRDQVLGSVKTLSASSGHLSEMADDVAKLARQTSLLSINAAIEAARAGPSGRGFAVVAGEVRRLSNESGDTGRRISSQVQDFAGCMRSTLAQASEYSARDADAIKASEATINEVMAQVDGTVSALNERAAELSARGEVIKAQVEQLMVSFQFQDRVHQIMSQVCDSMRSTTARLQLALSTGSVPSEAEWTALLSAGYTTDEQRAVASGDAQETKPSSGGETTFF